MKTKLLAVSFIAFSLVACGSDPEKPEAKAELPPPSAPSGAKSEAGLFSWLGGSGSSGKVEEKKGVAVNAYLWRASLDALSFMTMEQTDPFGGIIKTGWYVPPSTPNERLKVSVFILDSKLRAEAIRVSIFKQVKKPSGEWAEATVDPDTVTKLENVILDRARGLKIQSE